MSAVVRAKRTPKGVEPFPLSLWAMTYCAAKRKSGEISASTGFALSNVLRQFCAIAPTNPTKVKRHHVEQYMESRANLKPGTRRHDLSALRGFFDFLVIERIISASPALGIKGPRMPALVPKALVSSESTAIADAIDTESLDPRVSLMLALMYCEGMRRVEVSRALIEDIDVRASKMGVRGKGGREGVTRVLPLSDRTMRALARYRSDDARHRGPLFINANHKRSIRPLSREYIGQLATAALYELGIKTEAFDGVSPHALRHTALTEMIEAGGRFEKVQRFAGHSNPANTWRYTLGATLDLRELHELRR